MAVLWRPIQEWLGCSIAAVLKNGLGLFEELFDFVAEG